MEVEAHLRGLGLVQPSLVLKSFPLLLILSRPGEARQHASVWCLFPEGPWLECFWKRDISTEASGLLSIHTLLRLPGRVFLSLHLTCLGWSR